MAIKTYLQAISDGLREEMRRDERVFVIGEDVGVYGGAFKVTQGFQAEFGPWRVLDAPLAETAIVGACTGASLMGLRPVAEMQFADFISCAWDHLVTVAAKQHYRTGAALPFVVRCPSGGGFSGGPFHSQNPESSFAHIPGLKLVCPATPEDAKGLLIEAIRDPNPVLYFEHKHLYRRIKGEVPDTDYTTPFGKARVHRAGSDLTIVTWGAMVYTADEAADRGGLEGRHVGRGARPAHDHPVGPRGGARVRRAHRQAARAARGHAHRGFRRRDRGNGRRGELRVSRRAACCGWRRRTRRCRSHRRSRRRSYPKSTMSCRRSSASRRTEQESGERSEAHGSRKPRRRGHAPDGRQRLGRHDQPLGEAGRRPDRGRRDDRRDLDRQGRHRGAVPGLRHGRRDPRPGG